MLNSITFLLALICASLLIAGEGSDETRIRNLERVYWEYVKVTDLQNYRTLWH